MWVFLWLPAQTEGYWMPSWLQFFALLQPPAEERVAVHPKQTYCQWNLIPPRCVCSFSAKTLSLHPGFSGMQDDDFEMQTRNKRCFLPYQNDSVLRQNFLQHGHSSKMKCLRIMPCIHIVSNLYVHIHIQGGTKTVTFLQPSLRWTRYVHIPRFYSNFSTFIKVLYLLLSWWQVIYL